MNDGIIIQNCMSNGVYYKHIALVFGTHSRYALKHGYDYMVYLSDVFEGGNGGTSKLHIIKSIIDKYKYIVWLDADTIIADDETDFRSAFDGKIISIGAVEYKFPVLHLNAGMFVIKVTDESKRVFDELMNRPLQAPWWEQTALNEMANKYPAVVGPIDVKFNDWIGELQSEKPVVLAYHGSNHPDYKYDLMCDSITRKLKVVA